MQTARPVSSVPSVLWVLFVLSTLSTGPLAFAQTVVEPVPPLVSVSVYQSGAQTGQITVLVAAGGLVIVSPGLSEMPFRWGVLNAQLAGGEAGQLRSLLEVPDVRDLAPQSSWFNAGGILGGTKLLWLIWQDREQVYAIPPEAARADLPDFVKEAYRRIDAAVDLMDKMAADYPKRESSRVQQVDLYDFRVRDFDRQLARLQSIAQPPVR